MSALTGYRRDRRLGSFRLVELLGLLWLALGAVSVLRHGLGFADPALGAVVAATVPLPVLIRAKLVGRPAGCRRLREVDPESRLLGGFALTLRNATLADAAALWSGSVRSSRRLLVTVAPSEVPVSASSVALRQRGSSRMGRPRRPLRRRTAARGSPDDPDPEPSRPDLAVVPPEVFRRDVDAWLEAVRQ